MIMGRQMYYSTNGKDCEQATQSPRAQATERDKKPTCLYQVMGKQREWEGPVQMSTSVKGKLVPKAEDGPCTIAGKEGWDPRVQSRP